MTYTLHGRELKVGDKVWSIYSQDWTTAIGNEFFFNMIVKNAHMYAWDDPRQAVAAIPPPLGWVEGKPVRKGDVLYHVRYGGPCIPYHFQGNDLDFTGFSWSPPKRTEQRWVVFNGRGVVIATTPTALDAKALSQPHDGHQVFGPLDVEVT